MKRSAQGSPSARPQKSPRTTTDPDEDATFPATSRVQVVNLESAFADGLEDADGRPGHVEGEVLMKWEMQNKNKFQLTCPDGIVEATLLAPKALKVDIQVGMTVKLALRGAKFGNMQAKSNKKCTLEYDGGVVIQTIKGSQLETITYDLFPSDDWFSTPQDAAVPPSQPMIDQTVEPDFYGSVKTPEPSVAPLPPNTSASSLAPEARPTIEQTKRSPPADKSLGHSSNDKRQLSHAKKTTSNRGRPDPSRKPASGRQLRPAASLPAPRAQSSSAASEIQSDPDGSASGGEVEIIAEPKSANSSKVKTGANMKKRDQRRENEAATAALRQMKAGVETSLGRYYSLQDIPVAMRYEKNQCAGIVVFVGEPHVASSASGDLSVTLGIIDPSFNHTSLIFEVKIFADPTTSAALPSVRKSQAILLKQVLIRERDGVKSATGYKDSFKWVAFDAESARQTHGNHGQPVGSAAWKHFYRPHAQELKYMYDLTEWWRVSKGQMGAVVKLALRDSGLQRNFDTSASASIPNPPRARTSDMGASSTQRAGQLLLRDVQRGMAFDCVVKVARIWTGFTGPTEVYVTDYTQNPLFPMAHKAGPGNHRTMKLSMWDEQKTKASELEEGAYYRFRGVLAKFDRLQQLEGSLGGSSHDAFQRVTLSLKEVKEIIIRKERVDKDEGMDDPAEETLPDKAVESEAPNVVDRPPRPLTQPFSSTVDTTTTDAGELEGDGIPHVYVVNKHDSEATSTFEEIRSMTEYPRKFRIKARIKGYSPGNLQDWVRVQCTSCGTEYVRYGVELRCGAEPHFPSQSIPKQVTCCTTCDPGLRGVHQKPYYRAALWLEECDGDEMIVSLCGDSAEEFLRDLPARRMLSPGDTKQLRDYLKGVVPENNKASDPLTPYLDMCVAASMDPRGQVFYSLFGCQLVHGHIPK